MAEPAVAGLPHARPSRSLDSDVLARAEQMQTRMLFIAEEQHFP